MPDPVSPISPAVLLELASRVDVDGSLERAVADELGISAVRFWLAVNRLLDAPPPDAALEWGPTINRLRRVRERGQRLRQAG